MYSKLCVLVFHVLFSTNEASARGSIWDLLLPKQFKYETKKAPGEFGFYYNYEFPKSNIDPRTQNYFYRRDADKEKIAEAFEKNAHYITDQQFTILKNLDVISEKEAEVVHSAVNEIRFPPKEKVQSAKEAEKEKNEEDIKENKEDAEDNNEENDDNDEKVTSTENNTKEEDATEKYEENEEKNKRLHEEIPKEVGEKKNQTALKRTVVKHINNIKITAVLYSTKENETKDADEENTDDNHNDENTHEDNKEENTKITNTKEHTNEKHKEETKEENEQKILKEEDNSTNQTSFQNTPEKNTKNIKIVAELIPAKNK